MPGPRPTISAEVLPGKTALVPESELAARIRFEMLASRNSEDESNEHFTANEIMVRVDRVRSGATAFELGMCEAFAGRASVEFRIDDHELSFDGADVANVHATVWGSCIGGQCLENGQSGLPVSIAGGVGMRIGLRVLTFLGLVVASSGCGEDEGTDEPGTGAPASTVELPVDPTAPGSQEIRILEAESLSWVVGTWGVGRFEKKAGHRYVVDLTTIRGNFNLYGHYNRTFEPREHLHYSVNPGREADQIAFDASQDGEYFVLVHAKLGGSFSIYVEETRSPFDASPSNECKSCNSKESCQDLMDEIIERFPKYKARAAGRSLKFDTGGATCFAGSDTITCPAAWFARGFITNRLLFHELNHRMRTVKLENPGGASGNCSNGACSSSEFQATLLEEKYFPVDCFGSQYKFTDSTGVKRTSGEILEKLAEHPAISESELWDYVLGDKDGLADYVDRFGLEETKELYHSQTYL